MERQRWMKFCESPRAILRKASTLEVDSKGRVLLELERFPASDSEFEFATCN